MGIEIRPITEAELPEFEAAEDSAYSSGPHPEDRAAFKPLFDYERSLAAFDDGRIVGGACYFRLGLSVPGNEVDAAGVTFVFVVPTHRRRGIVTRLMRRQLDAMHDEGIPVAALHAAESSIYGRFGYGAAAHTETLEIERTHTHFSEPIRPPGDFRLVDDEEAGRLFPQVYEKYRLQTPGLFTRDGNWWNLRLRQHGRESGAPGWMKLVYERDGKPTAYAVYGVNLNWQDAMPQSQMQVEEIAYADEEGHDAIWRYLFGVDLVKSIRAFASVDPSLWWKLADPRRLTRRTRDGLWVRPVNVLAALASRSYLSDDTLIMRVIDEFCPWNDGVFRLESSGGSAKCEPAQAEPDVTVVASALGAVLLGGSNFHTLAKAGLAEGHTKGAVTRAQAMFSWHTAPMTSAPEPLT